MYKGLVPPMWGAAGLIFDFKSCNFSGINAVLFFLYDWTCQHLVEVRKLTIDLNFFLKKRLKANPLHNIQEATLSEVTIAGCIGGAAQTLVVTPFDLAKIKLQGQINYSSYAGIFF